jgi:hypothetical protein
MGEFDLQRQPPNFVHFTTDLELNSQIGFSWRKSRNYRVIYPTSRRLKTPWESGEFHPRRAHRRILSFLAGFSANLSKSLVKGETAPEHGQSESDQEFTNDLNKRANLEPKPVDNSRPGYSRQPMICNSCPGPG